MLRLIIFLLTGFAAALIVTGWQGYKDSPWENFSPWKFIRSYFVALLVGAVFYYLETQKILFFDNFGILFLSILSVERMMGELYKGFLRKQSHPEYIKLFERLRIKFKSFQIQLIVAIFFVATIAVATIFLLIPLVSSALLLPRNIAGLIIGFIGGLLSATGGAIKDSQFEGFKLKKFIRSPIVGLVGGLILVRFSHDPLLLLLSAIGFERVMVELYKTFIQRRVRGIFEGQKPKYPFWLKNRWIFFVLYSIGGLALIFSILLT
jgi:hypothetical protein